MLRYIIVKDKNSKLEALGPDFIKDSFRANPVIEDVVVDGLPIEDLIIDTSCGEFNLADIKSKDLKSIFGCKKKNKEDTTTIYGIRRKI